MIVKAQWKKEGKTYIIGIRRFLEALGVEKTDTEIKNAVKEIVRRGANRQ